MTKNRYAKDAIRARMGATGESYSVAARAIAELPIPSGWSELDGAIDGGFQKRALSLIYEREINASWRIFADIALSLMSPNRRVLIISDLSREEFLRDFRHSYLGERLLSETEEKRLKAHLKKNLSILPANSPIADIRAELESNSYGAMLVDNTARKYYYKSVFWDSILPHQSLYGSHDINSLKKLTAQQDIATVLFQQIPKVALFEGARQYSSYAAYLGDVILELENIEGSRKIIGFKLAKNRFGESGLLGAISQRG